MPPEGRFHGSPDLALAQREGDLGEGFGKPVPAHRPHLLQAHAAVLVAPRHVLELRALADLLEDLLRERLVGDEKLGEPAPFSGPEALLPLFVEVAQLLLVDGDLGREIGGRNDREHDLAVLGADEAVPVLFVIGLERRLVRVGDVHRARIDEKHVRAAPFLAQLPQQPRELLGAPDRLGKGVDHPLAHDLRPHARDIVLFAHAQAAQQEFEPARIVAAVALQQRVVLDVLAHLLVGSDDPEIGRIGVEETERDQPLQRGVESGGGKGVGAVDVRIDAAPHVLKLGVELP